MIAAVGPKETKEKSAAGHRSKRKFRPLARDCEIVRWVYEAGATTREQVQRLFFGPGGRTRCQERLALLVQNRYIDRLAGRQPNQPDVFVVGRRSTNGIRLLRASGGAASPKPLSPVRLQHQLGINACRVQVTAACRGEVDLLRWLGEDDLRGCLEREPFLPDAYFQAVRRTTEGERRSAFFLEVERSDKSDRLLREKFQAYGRFYYGGRYEEIFGGRALRVLFLIADSYGIKPERRVEKFSELAARLQVTFLRFAPLVTFLGTPPEEVLIAPIWRRPGEPERSPLFAE